MQETQLTQVTGKLKRRGWAKANKQMQQNPQKAEIPIVTSDRHQTRLSSGHKTLNLEDRDFIASYNDALNVMSIYAPKNTAVTFSKLKGSTYKNKGGDI